MTEGGAATVAVLLTVVPLAALTVALAVKVAVAPTGSVTVCPAMFPAPEGVVQEPPLAPTHVQVMAESPTGKVSVTTALVTALGPLFVTLIA